MTGETVPTRVTFSDRQFLRAADLRAEQRYHREARWRHNRGLHTWGVAAGLGVSVGLVNGRWEATAGPGMAVDGYGRELVVPYPLPGDRRLEADTEYDVWLEYAEADAERGTRRAELPRVRVTRRADRQNPDPARPDAVPAGHLDEFGPDRPDPDPAYSPWPVFLATARFRTAEEFAAHPWEVDAAERRYAGLVAERIEAPSQAGVRHTVLTTGREPGWSSYRFAVREEPATAPSLPPFLAVREVMRPADKPDDPPRPETRVEVRAEKVAVAGDLTLKSGAAVEFAANPIGREGDHAAPLSAAELWRIYRHFQPPGGMSTDTPSGLPELKTDYSDELRITMPGGSGGVNRVSVGSLTADGKFTPILTVKDDRTVEVNGVLNVNGEIHGKVSDAPLGQPAGGEDGLTAEQMTKLVQSHLHTPGQGSAPYITVLKAVGTAGNDTDTSRGLIGFLTDTTADPIPYARAWWVEPTGKAAEVLGGETSKASEATFTKFLGKFDSLSGGENAVTVFGEWVFTATEGKTRGAELAKGFPTDKKFLKEFAESLLNEPERPRLKALIAALTEAAEVRELVGALLDTDDGRGAVGRSLGETVPKPDVLNDTNAKLSPLWKLFAAVRTQATAEAASAANDPKPFTNLRNALARFGTRMDDPTLWSEGGPQ